MEEAKEGAFVPVGSGSTCCGGCIETGKLVRKFEVSREGERVRMEVRLLANKLFPEWGSFRLASGFMVL